MVCRSVYRSVCHTSQPCKDGCTDRDAVWVLGSDGPRNHVLDGGPAVLSDFAVATNFETEFAVAGFVGYNFGCMIASGTLFDSRSGLSGQAIR